METEVKCVIVEVPEPYDKTEDRARAFVVAALARARFHPDATVHEEMLYWRFHVKSYERVTAATVECPLDVRLVIELAEAIVRVARGQCAWRVTVGGLDPSRVGSAEG